MWLSKFNYNEHGNRTDNINVVIPGLKKFCQLKKMFSLCFSFDSFAQIKFQVKIKIPLKKKIQENALVSEKAESNQPKSQAYVPMCVRMYVYMKLPEKRKQGHCYKTECTMR